MKYVDFHVFHVHTCMDFLREAVRKVVVWRPPRHAALFLKALRNSMVSIMSFHIVFEFWLSKSMPTYVRFGTMKERETKWNMPQLSRISIWIVSIIEPKLESQYAILTTDKIRSNISRVTSCSFSPLLVVTKMLAHVSVFSPRLLIHSCHAVLHWWWPRRLRILCM